jgi:signal transduction histidine kinase
MVGDCLQTGTVYRRTEIETVSENGKLRRLGATVAPIDLPPERGPRGALCLLTDITEVTELREQVALKNNLESLGEMSAGLAHEFKNAIATLQGYAQLLQSMELNDKAQVAAGSLLNEVRNLSSMVTAFLNFARPQPLHLEDVPVFDLIADCAAELRLQSVIEVDPSLAIRADERMLRSALLNLMRNGAEANPDGEVSVTAAREDGNVVIQVRDTGPGISPADLQKIFIPFFTTKAKGHGIGLALTHRIITQHGGTLTATNSPNGGAVFTIKLNHG